jgi:hypothetical protein
MALLISCPAWGVRMKSLEQVNFFLSFFVFPLLFITSLLFRTDLSPHPPRYAIAVTTQHSITSSVF